MKPLTIEDIAESEAIVRKAIERGIPSVTVRTEYALLILAAARAWVLSDQVEKSSMENEMEWREIESAPKDGTIIRARHDKWPHELNIRWENNEWAVYPMRFDFAPAKFWDDHTHWHPVRPRKG